MQLKKFDLILIKRPTSIFGKLVKIFLKSEYSHVAIYVGNYHVIDTDLLKAVSLHEIDNALGDFDVYRYKGILNTEQERIIDEFFMKTLNSKYDILEAISVWLKLNVGLDKRYICISLATKAFEEAGIKIDYDEEGFGQITNNKYFKKINK